MVFGWLKRFFPDPSEEELLQQFRRDKRARQRRSGRSSDSEFRLLDQMGTSSGSDSARIEGTGSSHHGDSSHSGMSFGSGHHGGGFDGGHSGGGHGGGGGAAF